MFYETERNQHGLPHDPFLSCVVPRPIGWITTINRAGVINLAPFSFFNGVALDPPQVMLGAGSQHLEGGVTDTQKNLEETGEFVANFVTWELREQQSVTATHVGRDVSEVGLAGLEMTPSRLVKPPRVKASPIHLEGVYVKTVELLANKPATHVSNPYFLVLGKIIGVHINDDIMTDGMVDASKFRPLARMGYMDYAVIDHVFPLPFPDLGPDPEAKKK